MVHFDLQTFLSDMRREQKEDHDNLASELREFRNTLASHDKRIERVEDTRKTLRWVGGLLIAGMITVAIDVVSNHMTAAPQKSVVSQEAR